MASDLNYVDLERTLKTRWCHLKCAIYFQPTIQNPIQHESASPLDVPNQNRQKKKTSSFGNEPPLTHPPAAAANHTETAASLLSIRPTDACLAAPADR